MGLYIYLNSTDYKTMRTINDKDIQELFDEALEIDRSLMIWEHIYYDRPKWYKKKNIVYSYRVYHEQYDFNGNTIYQAREQSSACGDKKVVMAYLYGIINGSFINKNNISQ